MIPSIFRKVISKPVKDHKPVTWRDIGSFLIILGIFTIIIIFIVFQLYTRFSKSPILEHKHIWEEMQVTALRRGSDLNSNSAVLIPKLEDPKKELFVIEEKAKFTDSSLNEASEVKLQSNIESTSELTSSLFIGCERSIPVVDHGPHIVPPPEGPVTLVCCQTTAGPLSIAVHPSWSPLGAENFLNMVRTGFFSSKVGLFRALKDFITQFGLAGDPVVQEAYDNGIRKEPGEWGFKDDFQWLPKQGMINGVNRFQEGYISYAGGGSNSRSTQLFITTRSTDWLGGDSPWETPIGQIVGVNSYKTAHSFYTEYGEAPNQHQIRRYGNKYLEENFPNIDYITSCNIVDEDLPWKYEPL